MLKTGAATGAVPLRSYQQDGAYIREHFALRDAYPSSDRCIVVG